ncbi:MAG TPA: hypothetical protein PLL78_14370 [Fimbriimonadaceae bacterium]|nr:hypothetical protein [Fimbriimonadaceae bacterium]HRJ97860.1 hypothetical protein [Fimbriimonadaceae bacterium]
MKKKLILGAIALALLTGGFASWSGIRTLDVGGTTPYSIGGKFEALETHANTPDGMSIGGEQMPAVARK